MVFVTFEKLIIFVNYKDVAVLNNSAQKKFSALERAFSTRTAVMLSIAAAAGNQTRVHSLFAMVKHLWSIGFEPMTYPTQLHIVPLGYTVRYEIEW